MQGSFGAHAAQATMAGAQGGRSRWLDCAVLSGQPWFMLLGSTYPAHNGSTALALCHHVPRALAHHDASTRQLGCRTRAPTRLLKPRTQACPRSIILKFAVQRVADKLVAVLEEIGTELSAGAREIVQRVEVELAGKLSDYAVG
jgi:hypothetical protein